MSVTEHSIKLDGELFEIKTTHCGCFAMCNGWRFYVDGEPYGNIDNVVLYNFTTSLIELYTELKAENEELRGQLCALKNCDLDGAVAESEVYFGTVVELKAENKALSQAAYDIEAEIKSDNPDLEKIKRLAHNMNEALKGESNPAKFKECSQCGYESTFKKDKFCACCGSALKGDS